MSFVCVADPRRRSSSTRATSFAFLFDTTMSIKFTCVWAFLVVTTFALAYGNSCGNGPPGRFFIADLLGWYKCREEGGEMIQKEIVQRSEGKRCDCGDRACNTASQDPCGALVDYPVFPPVFTTYYIENVVQCDAKACNTSFLVGEGFQNANEGKMRNDRTSIDFDGSAFVRKGQSSGYDRFDVRWDQTDQCTKRSLQEFPRFEFAEGFTYAGNYTRDGVTYYMWEKTTSQGSYSQKETWVTKKNEQNHDVPWTYDLASADAKAKTSQTFSVEFSSFDEKVDEDEFVLPKFCEG